ncbi:MAG: flavodoxin family protein [Bacillota bacterium]
MRILALIGSPRTQSNTGTLVAEVVRGARSAGATCETINVCKIAIAPCKACETCERTGKCAQDDDMHAMYPKILDSDGFIIGSPVYWWGPSAQMKTFLDRWYALIHRGGRSRFRGKKAVIVTAYGDDDPSTSDHLVGMFRRSFEYLGIDIAGLLGVTASEPGEVLANTSAMKEAYDLGVQLARMITARSSIRQREEGE